MWELKSILVRNFPISDSFPVLVIESCDSALISFSISDGESHQTFSFPLSIGTFFLDIILFSLPRHKTHNSSIL